MNNTLTNDLSADAANDLADLFQDMANDLADAYATRLAETPGMYRNPATGAIYRVKMNQAGTGMYAFALRGESWEYIGGLGKNGVLERFRMTLEECDAYSVHIGHCCLCGRGLTNLKSVGLGMGPVCRKRQANRA